VKRLSNIQEEAQILPKHLFTFKGKTTFQLSIILLFEYDRTQHQATCYHVSLIRFWMRRMIFCISFCKPVLHSDCHFIE
jgi:hypothetical protein